MIIENIEYSNKYNLIRLTISDEFFYVDYDFYYDHSFKENDEISFDCYKEILKVDSYNRAKNMALKKISYSPKSSFEIKKKLSEKKFDEATIDKVISYLNSYGFLDDKAYVKSYISDKDELSRWSKNKIAYMLKSKHIDQNIIDEYISVIGDDREYEKARFFAEKKARDNFSFENRQKVFRHLAGKGFDIDIINKVLADLFK